MCSGLQGGLRWSLQSLPGRCWRAGHRCAARRGPSGRKWQEFRTPRQRQRCSWPSQHRAATQEPRDRMYGDSFGASCDLLQSLPCRLVRACPLSDRMLGSNDCTVALRGAQVVAALRLPDAECVAFAIRAAAGSLRRQRAITPKLGAQAGLRADGRQGPRLRRIRAAIAGREKRLTRPRGPHGGPADHLALLAARINLLNSRNASRAKRLPWHGSAASVVARPETR